ncbi:MAG: nuclear transport factor 2 family protein [Pyrinomonadaceae bacterium]
MKKFIVSVLIIVVTVSMVFAQARAKKQTNDVEQQLLKINKEYDEALVRGDIAALERIFGDEFIYTSTSGEVVNKPQQLELIRSGALKIASGASDDVQVRPYGNIALVIGSFIAKGEFKGKTFDSTERYTSVWLKRGGRWQLIAEQGTLVPKQ